jgi:hypothetical protein
MTNASPCLLLCTLILAAVALIQCAHAADAPASAPPVNPQVTLDPATTLIVIPDNPTKRNEYAGALLRDWLRKAARATTGFDMVKESSPQAANPKGFILAVGPTRWADAARTQSLIPDSYSLQRRTGAVAISGAGEDGAVFGVLAFLDKVANIRFYIPGPQFTSLPANPAITLADLDIISQPYVASCFMSGIELGDPIARQWLTNNAGFRRKGGTHQHNMFAMFPPEKYAATHPEIYPILSGKRHIPQSARDQAWQLNFLEPKTIDIAEQAVLEFYKNNSNDAYATLSINDGHDVSQDPVTLAWIKDFQAKNPGKESRDRAFSAIYWDFISRLGARLLEKAPGKRLVCLAYGPTRFPPAQKLPSNIVVFTNYHVAELPTEGIATPGKTPLEGWLDPWLAVTDHLGNHDWYQGSGYLVPRIYSGYWATFLRTLKSKVKDPYMHAECYPNWGLDGPKLWVLTRLWWDPTQDPDKLTRQFCDDMFGPGADAMARYFKQLENFWEQINITDGPERKLSRWDSQFKSTPASRAMIAQARVLLDEALATKMDDAQKARATFFSDCFGMTERFFALAAKASVSETDLKEGEDYIQNKVLSYPLSLHHKHLTLPAWREVYWARLKAQDRPLVVPWTSTPNASSGVIASDWLVKGAGTDPQKTSAKLARDATTLYIQVTCPHKDPSKLVEADDDTWRSDNIELFFDLNADKSIFERQMWVKTNGRVVDFSGRENPNKNITGKVTKSADAYIVDIAVPLAYAQSDAGGKTIGIMMVRNEFQKITGMNQSIYASSWNGILTLADAK